MLQDIRRCKTCHWWSEKGDLSCCNYANESQGRPTRTTLGQTKCVCGLYTPIGSVDKTETKDPKTAYERRCGLVRKYFDAGASDQEIAKGVGYAQSTVKSIRQKLGLLREKPPAAKKNKIKRTYKGRKEKQYIMRDAITSEELNRGSVRELAAIYGVNYAAFQAIIKGRRNSKKYKFEAI